MLVKDKQSILNDIDRALDDIRPHLEVDGGNVELVELTDDMTVKIRWMGNCEMCNMSAMTMKAGIEQAIKSRVPNITGVEAVNGIGV